MATIVVSINNGQGAFAHTVIPDAYHMDNWFDAWYMHLSNGHPIADFSGHVEIGINYGGDYTTLARVAIQDGKVNAEELGVRCRSMMRLAEMIDSTRRHFQQCMSRYEGQFEETLEPYQTRQERNEPPHT